MIISRKSSTTVQTILESRHKKSKLIVLLGVGPGVGVTHTAILLANYLRRNRLKVALIEGNSSQHFARIEGFFEGVEQEALPTDSFRIKKIDYYKAYPAQSCMELQDQGYDVLLLDMGSQVKAYSDLYKTADYQLIIGHGCDWKRVEHQKFLEKHEEMVSNRTQWLLPFCHKNEAKIIERVVGKPCTMLGYAQDPFVQDPVIDHQLEKIFKVR